MIFVKIKWGIPVSVKAGDFALSLILTKTKKGNLMRKAVFNDLLKTTKLGNNRAGICLVSTAQCSLKSLWVTKMCFGVNFRQSCGVLKPMVHHFPHSFNKHIEYLEPCAKFLRYRTFFHWKNTYWTPLCQTLCWVLRIQYQKMANMFSPFMERMSIERDSQ